MSHLVQHLRFAVRSLRQQPGLALAALLTLALGIGVNSAIFSVVDAVLLTPPPFRDPGRLVIVWASNEHLAKRLGIENKIPVTNTNLTDLQQGSKSFEREGLVSANRLTLTGQGDPEQLGAVYKQLNAPFGEFGLDTLEASTVALTGDDTTYSTIEAQIATLTTQRDALAAQIRSALNGAAFRREPLDETRAAAWIQQAQSLIDKAVALASQ